MVMSPVADVMLTPARPATCTLELAPDVETATSPAEELTATPCAPETDTPADAVSRVSIAEVRVTAPVCAATLTPAPPETFMTPLIEAKDTSVSAERETPAAVESSEIDAASRLTWPPATVAKSEPLVIETP